MNETQVLALAPDAASGKAGKDLATAIAKWKNMGCNTLSIWGECQGSGKEAYRTQIDINDTAFKCSCPSRKFPCKHGIGLYLLYVRNKSIFVGTEPPVWVEEWISKRQNKAARANQPDEPISEEKAEKQAKDKEKRTAQRTDKVQSGIEELSLLLKDLIKAGLLSFQNKNNAFWEQKAARMIDAQASGIANLLRAFKYTDYTATDWQEKIIAQLSRLHLLANAFQNLDKLPPLLQEDVKNIIGWSAKKEDILNNPDALTIEDTWLVGGKWTETDIEQKITTQYLWLYGQKSRQDALILEYSTPHSPFSTFLTPGTALEATLTFYPSIAPFRALIREKGRVVPFQFPSHLHANFEEMGQAYSQKLAQQPFIEKMPYWVKQLNVAIFQNKYYLFDTKGLYIPIHKQFSQHLNLLAISGGQPIDMYVIYLQNQLIPMGVWAERYYEILDSSIDNSLY